MIKEYYTLGSRSEKEGLTLMTRILHEDGSPCIQYGSPEEWYKPQQITKEEYEQLSLEMRDPPMGSLGIAGGLLDQQGYDEMMVIVNAQRQKVNEDRRAEADMQILILNKFLSDNDGLTQDQVEHYIHSMNIRPKVRSLVLEDYRNSLS